MAFTVAQLTALEDAIASGELTVSYEGKTVTYRSMDDLLKAYQTVKAALADAGSVTDNGLRTTYTEFSKD